MDQELDVLPQYILEKLKSLQLELEDGDITQKGYDKKRQQILTPYTELLNRPAESTRSDTQSVHNADDGSEAFVHNQAELERERQLVEQELGPEPSAADVDDFLDFLPSPTHTPAMDFPDVEPNNLAHSQSAMLQPHEGMDRDLRATQSMTNIGASASTGDMKKSLSSDARPDTLPPVVPSATEAQYYSRPLPVPPAAMVPGRGRPPPDLSVNIPGRQPTFGRPPPPANVQMMARPMAPNNQFSTFPPNVRPPGYRPGQPTAPYPQRPMYQQQQPQQRPPIPGQPLPLRPMASVNHRPPPAQSAAYGNYPQQPGMRPRNWIPDPGNGPRKRRSTDQSFIAERLDGPGLAKSQTIRNVDTGSQRDWDTASVRSVNRTSGHARSPSMMSTMSASQFASPTAAHQTDARFNHRRSASGSSRYSSSGMVPNFRALEPPPQPMTNLGNLSPQTLLQLAGNQMLPLEPREVPPGILDINGHTEMSCFSSIAEILRHRALNTGRTIAFTSLDPKGKEVAGLTWEKVNARAEKVAHLIRQKSGLNLGDRAALIYRKAEILDFVVAMLGCFLAGIVAVPINAAEEMAELSFILSSTNVYLALTTDYNLRAFTKDLQSRQQEFPPNIEWWKTNEFGSWYPKSKSGNDYPEISLPDLAYIEYSKAPNGELKGVAISHRTIMAQCAAYKAAVSPSEPQSNGRAAANGPDTVVTYLEPRQQAGLILGLLCSVFSGNHTIFVSSTVMDSAAIWVNILSKYRATIAVADYTALQGITRQFSNNRAEVINYNKKQPADLSSMRLLLIDTTIVDAEIDAHIAENLLLPLGVDDPLAVVCPMSSLPEHGGMILSLRDYLGPAKLEEVVANDKPDKDGQMSIRWIQADGSSRDYWECLLDREAFKDSRVRVLATGAEVPEQLTTTKGIRATAFGFAMPEATIAVVDPETTALCAPDTIGEIWVDSPSLSGGFWALPKHTEAIFHARPLLIPPDTLYPEPYDQEFLRTGLLGTVVGGRIVVFGLYEDRVRQQKLGAEIGVDEVHFAPDLVKTVLKRATVENCAIFEVLINGEHLPVVVCESNFPKDELARLADRVAHVLMEDHGLRVYTVLCKKAYELGRLNPVYVKVDVDNTIFNLPKKEEMLDTGSIWQNPAAYEEAIRRGLIYGGGLPQHTGMEPVREVIDERTGFDLNKFSNIVDILLWRTAIHPDETAFIALENKGKDAKAYSWRKINGKIASTAYHLTKKGLRTPSRAVIAIPYGLEFVQAVLACLVLGVVPIPVEPMDLQRIKQDITAILNIASEQGASHILTNAASDELFKNKQCGVVWRQFQARGTRMPEQVNISKMSKYGKLLGKESGYTVKREWLSPDYIAMITINHNSDMVQHSARLSHQVIISQCRTQKITCQMRAQRGIVANSLCGYSGIGLLMAVFCGIYVGSPTLLMNSTEYFQSSVLFFEWLQRLKVKDTVTTYPLLQYAMNHITTGEHRRFTLQNIQNMMISTDGRPKPHFYHQMLKYFHANRLGKEAINTVYSNMINPMITTRSYMLMEPITLLVDLVSLRRGIVRVLPPEEEALGILLHDSGIVPSTTMIAIVNPETRTVCPANVVGEIWVVSDSNVKGFTEDDAQAYESKFAASIQGGDPRITYARTGDVGFLWSVQRRVGAINASVEEGQCLFVLGKLNEAFHANGCMYFPQDIESSIERCHPSIPPGGAITFHAVNELVAVVAVKTADAALSVIPSVVNTVLQEHTFLIDVIVVVSQGNLPKTKMGEKQRGRAHAAYMEKSLQAIHTRRITNQNAPLELPVHSESQHNFDNDAASFMSRRRSVKSGLSGQEQSTRDDTASGEVYTPHSPAQSQFELPRVDSPTPLDIEFDSKQ
ncbi:unnamed protein product [Umbelopsis sp. WA50703]